MAARALDAPLGALLGGVVGPDRCSDRGHVLVQPAVAGGHSGLDQRGSSSGPVGGRYKYLSIGWRHEGFLFQKPRRTAKGDGAGITTVWIKFWR